MAADVREMIRRHEGERLKVYKCSEGYLTIGVGRNLETVGITSTESTMLFENDLARCYQDLMKFRWWTTLSHDQRAALVDMRFNLGPTRFREFRKMLFALEQGDWDRAAREMLDSKWEQQVKGRAYELAGLMQHG